MNFMTYRFACSNPRIIKKITFPFLLVSCLFLVVACAPLSPELHAVSANGVAVKDQIRLDANGVELFVDVSGKSDEAPLLLILHGGPGNVALGLVAFQVNVGHQLEEDYLVAYFHQRGVGLSSPVPSSEQTIVNHIYDVDEVAEYLMEKYGKNKIHIAGHSWGGMLAVLYADQYPDKVDSLVLMATAMNFRSMLRDSLELTLEWARENDVKPALEMLGQNDLSFNTWQDFTSLSRWANQARGGITANFDMAEFLELNNINEKYPDWNAQMANIAQGMIDELLQLNLDKELPAMRIPALFICGNNDTIIPCQSMQRDYENYGGQKKFVVLDNSHHLVFMDQPSILTEEIKSFLMEQE